MNPNEHMKAGKWLFLTVDEFENAPPDCKQTEDGCALEAYLCPSGQWTIGDGCCFWEDGTPVKKGDTLPDGPGLEERRRSLLAYNVAYCEEYVRKHVKVPLNQYQFDMLCDFRFNTRETTLRNSSRLLPAINAREWQKAALAMTEFVYGGGTKKGPVNLPNAGWRVQKEGNEWWSIHPIDSTQRVSLGTEEKSYPYQDAHRGLSRRRLWNALVFLGYDPTNALPDKRVVLPCKTRLLSTGVWRDEVDWENATRLDSVRMDAEKLPEPELVLDLPITTFKDAAAEVSALPDKADPPAPKLEGKAEAPELSPQPTAPATSAHVNEPVISSHDTPAVSKKPPEVNTNPASSVVESPDGEAGAAPVPSAPPAPAPPIIRPSPVPPVIAGQAGTKPPSQNTVPITNVPYRIDPSAGLKPMEESDRWKASVAQNAGMLLIRVSRYGAFGTGIKATADIVEQDGVLMQTFQMFFLVAAMAVIGYGVRVYGDWKRRRAEQMASQALY